MARATSIKRKRSRCPERLLSSSEAAGIARSSGLLPGCPRKAKNPSAPFCSSYSAAPRQWHLGSARASPSWPRLSTTSRDGRRRVRSTSATHISKTSTLAPSGCRRTSQQAAGHRRAPRSTTQGPLRPTDPVAPKGILRRFGREQGPTSDAPSSARLALRALTSTRIVETTEDRFHRRSGESDGFPDPGRLSSARSSREPC